MKRRFQLWHAPVAHLTVVEPVEDKVVVSLVLPPDLLNTRQYWQVLIPAILKIFAVSSQK
jgi:hypothetical protein